MNRMILTFVLIIICSELCQAQNDQNIKNVKNDYFNYLNKVEENYSNGEIQFHQRFKEIGKSDTVESKIMLNYRKVDNGLSFPFNYYLDYSIYVGNDTVRRWLNPSFFYELNELDNIITVYSNRDEKSFVSSIVMIDVLMPFLSRPDLLKQYFENADGEFFIYGGYLCYSDMNYKMWISITDFRLVRIEETIVFDYGEQYREIVFNNSVFDKHQNNTCVISGDKYFDGYRIDNNGCIGKKDFVGYCPGTPTPITDIILSDNSNLSLSNSNDEYSLLFFYFRQCGACTKVLRDLQGLNKRYIKNVNLIGICIGDNDVDAIHNHVIANNYPLQYSIDSLKSTWGSFNLFSAPSLIVLNGDGIIIGSFRGYDKRMKKDIISLIDLYNQSY